MKGWLIKMSNKNRKIAGVSSEIPVEQRSQKAQEDWLNGHPTRGEVTQFVDGFVNNEVVPLIMNMVGKDLFQLKCMTDVLMKYVIDSGVCTAEEFEKTYKEYYSQQMKEVQKRQEELRKEQEAKERQRNSGIITPDKTIIY